MELIILGSIIASGIYFNKQPSRQTTQIPRNAVIPNDKPNGSNIYSSNVANEADFEILKQASVNYQDSQDPKITGILPPIFNTYGINGNAKISTNLINSKNPLNTLTGKDMNIINEINKRSDVFNNGTEIPITNRPMFNKVSFGIESNSEPIAHHAAGISSFTKNPQSTLNQLTGLPYDNAHENMVPFFGGNMKQNIEELTNIPLLDIYTGNTDTFIHKKEVGSFHTLQKQDIHGTPNITLNTDINRYIPSNYKQSQKPFYEERVAAPIAGTIYNNIRNYGQTVDDLRVKSKPKLSYEGRTLSGQFMNVRGYQPPVQKNLVDTYYNNTPDMWLKTTGLITAKTSRDHFNMKPTIRQDTGNETYIGPSYDSQLNKTIQRTQLSNNNNIDKDSFPSIVQEPTRQSFMSDYIRNVGPAEKHSNDYGKNGYTPYITERAITGETNQFDLNVNNSNRAGTIRYQDNARNTIKETTLLSDNSGNIKSDFSKNSTYAVDKDIQHWDAKTTNKQALVNNKYIGVITKDSGMGYTITNYDAKTTNKETTMVDYKGTSNNSNKNHQIYSTYEDPIKTRNVTSVEYTGSSAPLQNNTMSRHDYNNAEINDRQEKLLLNSRSNGQQWFNINAGCDLQGNFKYTDKMALKEESSLRKLQDVEEFINPSLPKLTTILENIGTVENKKETESEIQNNRITPQYIIHQLKDNPYYINTQGKL